VLRPSRLCYGAIKKSLDLAGNYSRVRSYSCLSHRMKRMKQHQAALKKGLKNPDTEDPFELFIASTNIRYCYYKESHKILGNTFGMCVLQVYRHEFNMTGF
jgi:tRNA(Met) C34 N-acetyltransferase TmcA